MWFQDLFNYDFRRTEQCIIPYATQEGEITFCAYNTGVGWRNIIEKMHMTATLTKWYEEKGRHEIFAGGKKVELATTDHRLVLDPVAVAAGKQTDLDEKGIAKTAREEKLRARAEAEEEQRRGRADGLALSSARAQGSGARAGDSDPRAGWAEEVSWIEHDRQQRPGSPPQTSRVARQSQSYTKLTAALPTGARPFFFASLPASRCPNLQHVSLAPSCGTSTGRSPTPAINTGAHGATQWQQSTAL